MLYVDYVSEFVIAVGFVDESGRYEPQILIATQGNIALESKWIENKRFLKHSPENTKFCEDCLILY